MFGCFSTRGGSAWMAYSMPLPPFISPKVDRMVLPFKPSEGFTLSLVKKGMSGQPCWTMLIFLFGTLYSWRMFLAALAMTTIALLRAVISFSTFRAFGSKSGWTVWSVVTTGFCTFWRKDRMYFPH